MIVEIGGSEGGFKKYLETGQKVGRSLHRNQLDQRIPLHGDLDVFEHVTSSYKTKGKRYDHVTLSFSEHHVSDEMLQIAISEFRNHIFAAWPENERHRIAFYAEAHRPKILSYLNAETGERVQRFTHVHIGIGKRDLLTGRYVDILGYLGAGSGNLRFIDGFQESFNSRYGFGSPKDHPKITPETAIDTLARYSGHIPDHLQSFNGRKTAVEIELQKQIIARDVCNWTEFGKLLSEYGVVSKVNAGNFNEIYRVTPGGSSKAMRLRGIFFSKSFIEKSTQEKLALIMEQAKQKYLEQMQPKKEDAYIAQTLMHWHKVVAREIRYLHKSSRFFKDVYLPADGEARLKILDELEIKNNGDLVSDFDEPVKVGATSDATLNDISINLSELLGNVKLLPIESLSIDEHRQSNEKLVGNSRNVEAQRVSDLVFQKPPTSTVQLNGKWRQNSQEIIQPSSVISRARLIFTESHEQKKGKSRYAEIGRNLDCELLLNQLSHSHGLNRNLYEVTSGNDGWPRIRCGCRSLTSSDFLTKELGFMWKEAAPILRQVYEIQISQKMIGPRGGDKSGLLWRKFKNEQKTRYAEVTKKIQDLNVEIRGQRTALVEKHRYEKNLALVGLYGIERKSVLAVQNFQLAAAKAEFQINANEMRLALQLVKGCDQGEAWKKFLQLQVRAGNIEALNALRDLDDSSRRRSPGMFNISGAMGHDWRKSESNHLRINQLHQAAIFKGFKFTIALNGDMTYLQEGCAVLRDEGQHIAVLDQYSEDAILAGLLLGREKFGKQIVLTGSDDFKQRAVAISVGRGVAIIFSDPILEDLRQKLIAKKRVAINVTLLPAVEKPAVVMRPVEVEPITFQFNFTAPEIALTSESIGRLVVPDAMPVKISELPSPLSAKIWLGKWAEENNMAMSEAIPGHSKVPFLVLYKSEDGVVLKQGRTVAIYSQPFHIDLQVGEKVLVDKDKQICAIFVNENQRSRAKSRA